MDRLLAGGVHLSQQLETQGTQYPFIQEYTSSHVIRDPSYEQPHLFTGKKSRLQGTVFWGPEVALPGERDRN